MDAKEVKTRIASVQAKRFPVVLAAQERFAAEAEEIYAKYRKELETASPSEIDKICERRYKEIMDHNNKTWKQAMAIEAPFQEEIDEIKSWKLR